MSAFHDVVFPPKFSLTIAGGIGFNTEIVALNSGAEERVSKWPRPKRKWDVDVLNKTKDEMAEFIDFYQTRSGAQYAFKVIDPFDGTSASDHQSTPGPLDHELGIGDGSTNMFQFKKFYVNGGVTRTDILRYIVPNTARIAVDGVETTSFSLNNLTGLVTLGSMPINNAVITGGCEFYRRARFSSAIDRQFNIETTDNSLFSAPNIVIEEDVTETLISESYWYGGAQYITPTVDQSLNHLQGRMVTVVPQGVGLAVLLEDPVNLVGGGPYYSIHAPGQSFFIKNHLGISLVNTEALKTYDVWLGLNASAEKYWIVA